jgi:putative SOS response-associated peptidase YedK
MCGRYDLSQTSDLIERLGIRQLSFEFTPRYNIAPIPINGIN